MMENQDRDLIKATIARTRHQWMNIAFDIALCLVPNIQGGGISPEDICREYDISPDMMVKLFELPEFARILKHARQRVKAMGDDAAIQLHAQVLASDLQERIYRRLLQPDADTKDMMRFYERLMSYGLLDPNTNGTNKQKSDSGNSGAAVTIVNMHIPQGIDGLDHIYKNVKAPIEGEVINGD